MEVIEAIRNRRSIRSFKSKPISKGILKDLLQVCRWAGTLLQQYATLGVYRIGRYGD